MLYGDYKWSARADQDNPKVIGGTDHAELDRTQGYEMIYFINSLAKSWAWQNVQLSSFHNLEKVIRTQVPSNIQTHAGIKAWIESHYKNL